MQTAAHQQDQYNVDVAIIGAGIAGIMAAQQLHSRGWNVIILEKSRGVGGRMATRRIGPGVADTGAQFFTIRAPMMQALADIWLENGLIFEWSRGWEDNLLGSSREDGHPRYAVNGGMTSLAKSFRPNIPIQNEVKITRLSLQGDQWQLDAENGERWISRAVISTPPVPQALQFCAAGDVPLTREDQNALERISYAPCLCALFWLDGEINLPAPGALQRPEHQFSWIADNQRKGISPEARIITMHMHPVQSDALYTQPDSALRPVFEAELANHLAAGTTIIEAQIKRWRYALPVVPHPARTLVATALPPLLFAGDAFDGPRIEGAVLSGIAAAEKINQALS